MLKHSGDSCLKKRAVCNVRGTKFTHRKFRRNPFGERALPHWACTLSGHPVPSTGKQKEEKERIERADAFAADRGDRGVETSDCLNRRTNRSRDRLRSRRARIPSLGNVTSLLPGYRTRALLIHGTGRSISLSLSLSLSRFLAVDAPLEKGRPWRRHR